MSVAVLGTRFVETVFSSVAILAETLSFVAVSVLLAVVETEFLGTVGARPAFGT